MSAVGMSPLGMSALADTAATREWLEADGLGGFASGTVAGIRTRRYHALLLVAAHPPTGHSVGSCGPAGSGGWRPVCA